jgi:hypothetical protein
MHKDNVNLLKWFGKFVYADIDSLSEFQITRMWINITLIKEYDILDQEIGLKELAPLLHIATERPDLMPSKESLKNEQSEFSDKFHDVLNNIRKEGQQTDLTDPFSLHLDVTVETIEDKVRVKFDRPRNALIKDNRLFLSFLQTINGFQVETFKQCLECGQWFFHFAKRERIFCSNLCAARKGNRERRAQLKEEDPVAYKEELKKSSERARKSYARRKK